MTGVLTLLGYHLRYRLWIADLNSDTAVLRIAEDHIAELLQSKTDPAAQLTIAGFKKQFAGFREEIDQLKHEMHLSKMNLAAQSKTDTYKVSSEDHSELEERYHLFKGKFDAAKQALVEFQ
jgi:hypothetical protein